MQPAKSMELIKRPFFFQLFSHSSGFRVLKILDLIIPFPNKPWFLSVTCTSLLKTLWEKEKLLVTSNFSSSHSVFYPFGQLSAILIKLEIVVCQCFEFERVKNLSFGKELRVFTMTVTSGIASLQI